MKIRKVIATPGLNGFYNDDKAAIRKGANMDGFIYRGAPVTPGFSAIRQPGACDMVQVKTPDLGALHNSVEAVLYCKKVGKLAYLGGSCAETDQSARLCANIALATQPYACSGKPGMGVDEAMMIVHNEMQRVLAACKARAQI